MMSVQVRGFIKPEDAVAPGANVVDNMARIMIVYDRQPNGAIATIANILSAATSVSFMNLDNRDRFKVICDIHFKLGPRYLDTTATQTYAYSGANGDVVNIYRKLGGIKTHN